MPWSTGSGWRHSASTCWYWRRISVHYSYLKYEYWQTVVNLLFMIWFFYSVACISCVIPAWPEDHPSWHQGWEHHPGWEFLHQAYRLWLSSLHGGRQTLWHILWNARVLLPRSTVGKQVSFEEVIVVNYWLYDFALYLSSRGDLKSFYELNPK